MTEALGEVGGRAIHAVSLRDLVAERVNMLRGIGGTTDYVEVEREDGGGPDFEAGWSDLEIAEQADEIEALLDAPDVLLDEKTAEALRAVLGREVVDPEVALVASALARAAGWP